MLEEMVKLTANFALHEFLRSHSARAAGISDPVPTREQRHNLGRLSYLLQWGRDIIGKPITITSGLRSPQINAHIMGAKGSQHLKGLAADFIIKGHHTDRSLLFGLFCKYVQYKLNEVSQLIFYVEENRADSWIHIAVFPDGLSHRPFPLVGLKIDGNFTSWPIVKEA